MWYNFAMKKVSCFLKHNYIYIIMIVLVIARILLGYGLGGWFGLSETYDDVAMIQGLNPKRFIYPNHLTLIKDLSFSVFLGASAVTGLPYTIVLSMYWALTAFVVWILVKKVCKNKWVQLGAFAYVLFLPIAFTSWGGLRIYRNAIIAPSIILTFSLLLIGLINLVREEKLKKSAWIAVLAGLVFAFSYYLKEDGIWMMACLAVLLIIEVAIILVKRHNKKKEWQPKRIVQWVAVCFIPYLVWFGWTNIYKGVNHAFFGVYETNTRTQGELGRFVEEIYKIDSPNRNWYCWAPLDAIEAAFEASPTLGAHPKLLEEIKTTGFQPGGIEENPIGRDFLTWIMRSELVDSGLWTSEEDVNNLFAQVNAELDEAFENGTLKEAEGRIQLLASTGGYTWEEIRNSDILLQIWYSLEDSIWFTRYTDIGFTDGDVAYGTQRGLDDATKVNRVLHMTDDVNVVNKPERKIAQVMAKLVLWGYRAINSCLVIVTLGVYVYAIVGVVKNRKRIEKYLKKNCIILTCAITSVGFLGITILYSFATAWFFSLPLDSSASYANDVFVFYRVGVPGLLTIVFLSAYAGLFSSKKLQRKI